MKPQFLYFDTTIKITATIAKPFCSLEVHERTYFYKGDIRILRYHKRELFVYTLNPIQPEMFYFESMGIFTN